MPSGLFFLEKVDREGEGEGEGGHLPFPNSIPFEYMYTEKCIRVVAYVRNQEGVGGWAGE